MTAAACMLALHGTEEVDVQTVLRRRGAALRAFACESRSRRVGGSRELLLRARTCARSAVPERPNATTISYEGLIQDDKFVSLLFLVDMKLSSNTSEQRVQWIRIRHRSITSSSSASVVSGAFSRCFRRVMRVEPPRLLRVRRMQQLRQIIFATQKTQTTASTTAAARSVVPSCAPPAVDDGRGSLAARAAAAMPTASGESDLSLCSESVSRGRRCSAEPGGDTASESGGDASGGGVGGGGTGGGEGNGGGGGVEWWWWCRGGGGGGCGCGGGGGDGNGGDGRSGGGGGGGGFGGVGVGVGGRDNGDRGNGSRGNGGGEGINGGGGSKGGGNDGGT